MRGRILIAGAAAVLVLPSSGLSGGGPGEQGFGYGKYPLEQRTFASCKRFEAALPFYRTCLADQAYRLVTRTRDPEGSCLGSTPMSTRSAAGWSGTATC
jgi:hypothetical protein